MPSVPASRLQRGRHAPARHVQKQHVLLVIAVVTAGLNAALDALFYVLIGPIGMPSRPWCCVG